MSLPGRVIAIVPAGIVLAAVWTAAQTPAGGPAASFTATTDNVSGAPDSVRIDILRWSTDAERNQVISAWSLKDAPAAAGRGAAGRAAPAFDPFGAGNDDAVRASLAPGAGGRGGRGGGSGAAKGPPPTPETSLAAALAKAPVAGHLWSSEVAGYAVRYAVRLDRPGGGQRIILITDRRLGAWNDLWKPAESAAVPNYEFSLVELHLNSNGEGEGKVSLTGKVSVDTAAATIALENYETLPVVLKNVKPR
jgi:hypothetical protein